MAKPQPKKSTLFILGAGASFSGGAPVMGTFLQAAENQWLDGNATWANEHFELVLGARRELQSAFVNSHIDIDNIEALFSTFEMACVVEQLGKMKQSEIAKLPTSLRHCILRTIELTLKYELHANEELVRSPRPYDAFAHLVRSIHLHKRFGPVTIITFNYDIAIDYALTRAGIPFDYGLGGREIDEDKVLLLKPHGSLNWTRSKGGEIQVQPVHTLQADAYWTFLGVSRMEVRRHPIETIDFLSPERVWGEQMRPAPYIVPPTWNKAEHQMQLRSVWKAAIRAMSVTNNLFVSGYSLPPSDQFFRSVFALGMMSSSMIDNFVVFDPGEVETTWRSICGSSVRDRNKFRHERTTFAGAISWIINNFELPGDDVLPLLRFPSQEA